ncbi:MAG: hypothetical protein DRN14_01820 [Thermoplasmata archaeon]|nr:MAG: hypothetical protein DRN14_01820 [Thermoplasmata archaeon]
MANQTTAAVVAAIIIIAVIAFAIGYYVKKPTPPPPGPTKVKIAFIFPGNVGDTAWNEAGYKGMLAFAAKHAGEIEYTWVQGVYDPAQIRPQIESYISQGYNLIVGLGFQFGKPMYDVAQNLSADQDVYFLAIAGAPQYISSRVSVADVRTDESGFVSGYLMIKMSQTKQVAFVAGMKVAELARSEVGQRSGIQYAGYDPDEVYHVDYVGDFHDVTKAKTETMGIIDQYNVDVVKAMGDGCQLGAISAAKEKKVYALMSGTYHPEVYPDGVLMYEVWHWEAVYEEWYQDYKNGNLSANGGKLYWLSMENGGLEIVNGITPSDLWSEVMDLVGKIKAGQIDTGFTPE